MSDAKVLMDEINALKRRIAQLEARTEHPGFAASDVMRLGTAQTATAAKTFPNTGLKIKDTDANHTLALTPGSNLTADRTLTVTTGDSNRTLTLTGNATLDQDVSTAGSPTFALIDVDNLRLNSNTLSSTSGVVAITPLSGQDARISLGGGGLLDVRSNTPAIRIANTSSLSSPDWDGVTVGDLDFYTSDSTTGFSASTVARVRAVANDASGNVPVTDLAFWTGSGNDGSIPTYVLSEKMRILYNGNVLIGTTTNSGYKLDISGTLRATGAAYLTDIRPVSDSTTAVQVKQAGGTAFVTFDSTNKRVGINRTPTGYDFEVTGNVYFDSSLDVNGNILPTGYVARSRVTNQSITASGSWSSSVSPGTNSAHMVTVEMYSTSGPTSFVEQAIWLVSSDNAGTKQVQVIGGVNTNHQVGHISGAIAITNGVAATRYFNVSILRIL